MPPPVSTASAAIRSHMHRVRHARASSQKH